MRTTGHQPDDANRPSEGITTTAPAPAKPPPVPAPASDHQAIQTAAPPASHSGRKRLIIAGVVLAVLALAAWFGIPMVVLAWNTVSTDDAYVNSHVTLVAPRVPGQVSRVLVDDNNRVKKG